MKLAAVRSAFPSHYYDQETLLAALLGRLDASASSRKRLQGLHRNVLVGGRHLALPLAEYATLASWGQANDAWIRVATEVGEAAVRRALDGAGLAPGEVDTFIFVSVTGVATPSIDALLVNRIGLPAHVKRVPIFGLGCVAGAAGLARAADYLLAYPRQVALLLAVELCSLTFQAEDLSVANLIASGLFGDGGAAAVVVGAERAAAGPRIVATRSIFYPGTEEVMGWRISEKGFRVVLSADIPDLVRRCLRADVDQFLRPHGISRRDIRHWICHPGGPRILEAMQEALEIGPEALDLTWKSLAAAGNLSSASVLIVLEEVLRRPPPAPGSYGLLLAMGPGFCSELVLLRW